ncbi:MAG: hypothetical protein ACTSVY_07215 [Candidatus Helarchaeota archaeon]
MGEKKEFNGFRENEKDFKGDLNKIKKAPLKDKLDNMKNIDLDWIFERGWLRTKK